MLSFAFIVTAPPSTIEIHGYKPNSKVEVRENQDLTLTCIVSDAKPAAQIQWFRNNIEFKPGKIAVTTFSFLLTCLLNAFKKMICHLKKRICYNLLDNSTDLFGIERKTEIKFHLK